MAGWGGRATAAGAAAMPARAGREGAVPNHCCMNDESGAFFSFLFRCPAPFFKPRAFFKAPVNAESNRFFLLCVCHAKRRSTHTQKIAPRMVNGWMEKMERFEECVWLWGARPRPGHGSSFDACVLDWESACVGRGGGVEREEAWRCV